MPAVPYLIYLVFGYLIGSVSNAVWVAKANGVDIFGVGSGNPGATNVKRAVGKKAGNLVFFLDLLKGFIVSILPFTPLLESILPGQYDPVALSVIGLIGALLGHSFSIFIKFRGGKGVATSMGGLLALMPPVVLIGAVVWVITFYSSRYVSLASILFSASLPVATGVFWCMNWVVLRSYGWIDFSIGCLLFLMILIRHIPNIKRLLKGEENKFVKASSKKEATVK